MVTNTDDTIDSRDIIERIEELRSIEDTRSVDETGELESLEALTEKAEGSCPDWPYGAQLIRDSYFEQAMDEMIDDCYTDVYSKDLPSFMSISIDYEMLRSDYTDVDFEGVTYWVR